MNNFSHSAAARLALLLFAAALGAGLAWPGVGQARDKAAGPAKHADKAAAADKGLAAQVRDLQAKVTRLEAALKKGDKGTPPPVGGMAGMPGPQKGGGMAGMGTKGMDMHGMMGGMGGGQKDTPGVGGMTDVDRMKGGGMGGTGMMDDDMEMMGMMGMGSMAGMGAKGMKMKMASALPGFPGASHVYHIGSTGFFLDHPEHITLATEQQATLNRAKQKALLDKSKAQRKIDEAEQELWELTGADEPDAKQVQAKVQQIERLRGDQLMAFIRSVGEAAKVLTAEQRKILLGQAKPDAHKAHAPSK